MPKLKRQILSSGGFTLIELLIVISIIGVLATMVTLQMASAKVKARDARRVSDISAMKMALELYFDENGSYPATTTMTALTAYVSLIPQDPSASGCTTNRYNGRAAPPRRCYGYGYRPAANPTNYQVWAQLERSGVDLNFDSDLIPTAAENATWSGSRIRNIETCNTGAIGDCVFDLGNKN